MLQHWARELDQNRTSTPPLGPKRGQIVPGSSPHNGGVRSIFPLMLALAVALSGCNRENENLARATAAHPQGRAVFERYNCIRCHENGEGGFGKRMIGNPKLRDLEYITDRILMGKTVGNTQMPAFPAMPKAELIEVSKFVRALAGWGE